MPLTIKCPKCMRALEVPDEAVGKMVRCLVCKETFALAQTAATEVPVEAITIVPAMPDEAETEERRRRREQEKRDRDRNDEMDLRPTEHHSPHRGAVILTLGILSLCFFCFFVISWVLGGVAISMANTDLIQIARRQMDPSGRGLTQTGKTLATLGVLLATLWFFLICCVNFSRFAH